MLTLKIIEFPRAPDGFFFFNLIKLYVKYFFSLGQKKTKQTKNPCPSCHLVCNCDLHIFLFPMRVDEL